MNQKFRLMKGNNVELLKELEDNSVDAIITDPPYGLSAPKNSGKVSKGGFMNKKWDYDVPSVEFWREALRVLKPGGHALSFGGTRTYHRLVVNMEDAGFEIRDQIQWIYGSGFPKSLNIGKAIDKMEGNDRIDIGSRKGAGSNKFTDGLNGLKSEYIDTKGQTEWEGWGTALKPANEPICVARKPLSEKSVAENVLKWRTGGLNIDGCRIGSERIKSNRGMVPGKFQNTGFFKNNEPLYNEGRFPANVILECICDDVIKGKKGGASRFFYNAKVSKAERNMGLDEFEDKDSSCNLRQQSGLPKAKSEYKVKNTHPTIKPVNLMAYLCKLITPNGGVILDPFMGSGSTGIAALIEGFEFIGMEMDDDYMKIAEARIEQYEKYNKFLK